jgi:hypothetical protein
VAEAAGAGETYSIVSIETHTSSALQTYRDNRGSRIARAERLLPVLRHASQHPHNPVVILLEPLGIALWCTLHDGGSRGREVLCAEEFGAIEHSKRLEGVAVRYGGVRSGGGVDSERESDGGEDGGTHFDE